VRWGNGPENPTVCNTDCSGLLMALFDHCQPGRYDETVFKRWLGSRRPTARRFYDAIAAERGFQRIPALTNARPGDIIAIKFPPGSSNTGHTMLVAGSPRPAKKQTEPLVEGTTQWNVTVLDSSAAGHGPGDTRLQSDGKMRPGLGKGILRLYVRPEGSIAGYTMSPHQSSPYFSEEQRQVAVGRFDPGYQP
jgi:hypothetical protein